jgi:hypothetical protein
MDTVLIHKLIFLSGIGHFILSLSSLFIPRVLNWDKHLQDLQPLFRQMFWTYAAYILVINFSFGVVSVFATEELLNGSFLSTSISLFIGLYWLARIGIQFFYFDKSSAPKGIIYTVGEIALITVFAVFTITYLLAFFFNIAWL